MVGLIRARLRLITRVGLVLVSITAGVGGLAYVGFHALRASAAWLQGQAPYQIPFENIQLVENPPAWYRGGSAAFLEGVRRDAHESASLPLLGLTPQRVKLAFLHNAWVDGVLRVSYPPQGIRVALRFRHPVARVRVAHAEQFLVDEQAILLPFQDVDLERLGPLIEIVGRDLVAPAEPSPGKIWKPPAGAADLSIANSQIPAAAKLAGFLIEKMRSDDVKRSPKLRTKLIDVSDGRGLFLMTDQATMILWADAPGVRRSANLTDEERWIILCHWAESSDTQALPRGDYWAFGAKALEHVPTRSHAAQTHPNGQEVPEPAGVR
jgi:hypothetical protein